MTKVVHRLPNKPYKRISTPSPRIRGDEAKEKINQDTDNTDKKGSQHIED